MRVTAGIVVALSLLWLAGSFVAAEADDFKKVRTKYRKYLRRDSLNKRHKGRVLLAKTKDPRALKLLADSYRKAEDPSDQVQYLLVSVATKYCGGEEHLEGYARWRAKNKEAKDAWLWYRSLIVHCRKQGVDDLQAIVRGKENVFLRAAAIEALVARRKDTLPLITELLRASLPEDPVERAVIVESLAAALQSQQFLWKQADFREPATLLIKQLDAAETLPRTKLVLARRLRVIFKTDELYTSAGPWLSILLDPDGKRKPGKTVARPTFVGIKATGMRIAYVIDMSDSMMIPLTGKEKEDLKGPITRGPGDKDKKEPKEEEAETIGPKASDLDWEKINCRFDAAREFLKLSLRQLTEEQSFTVIWFGTKAGLLASCDGMMQVNERNIGATIDALDRIRPGGKATNRPHGTLRGYTNLHGGLHRAFKAFGNAMVERYEYVNAETFRSGADTIFVLSDGAATWDDWAQTDDVDPEDISGDPETGKPLGKYKRLIFPSPYAKESWLLDDLRRLNLFRKCEIHCIGIGEARMRTLRAIAQIGMGKTRQIGGK